MDARKIKIALAGTGAASGIATAGYFVIPSDRSNEIAIKEKKESIRRRLMTDYSKNTKSIWDKKAEDLKNSGIKDSLSKKDNEKEENSVWKRLAEISKFSWDGDTVAQYCRTHLETDLNSNNLEVMDMVDKMCTQDTEPENKET